MAALALLLASGCGGGGGGQEEEQAEEEQASEDALESQDALNAALEQSFSESGAPGVVAAVQTPEDTWVGTLGVADLSSEEPMSADMHQRIGSVTKPSPSACSSRPQLMGSSRSMTRSTSTSRTSLTGMRSRCARWRT